MDVAEILKGFDDSAVTETDKDTAGEAGAEEETANSQALANSEEEDGGGDADDPESATPDTLDADGTDDATPEAGTDADDPNTDGEETTDQTDVGERSRTVGRKPETKTETETPTEAQTNAEEEPEDKPVTSDGLSEDTRKQILKMYHEAGFDGKTVEECARMKKAEEMGVSVEDLDRKEEDERILRNAKEALRKDRFDRMIENDIAAIRQAYPEMHDLSSVKEFDDPKRFGELRDRGLSASEAFLVTNRAGLEAARKKQKEAAEAAAAKQAGKAHLTGDGGRSAQTSDEVPPEVRKTMLGMYPDLSDKEMKRLYRQARKL